MRTIDITTTQKVIIQYPLASLADRFLGWLIDFLIIAVFTILFQLLMVPWLLDAFLGSDAVWEDVEVLEYVFVLPFIFFYTLAWENLAAGQTPGKMAIGTRVVKLDGDKPNFSDLALRWSFRWFDIYMTLGAIGSLLISSSPKSQRLGGILSNTTVIKANNRSRVALTDILKIDTIAEYEVTYPEVSRFTEQEMLLIKSTIDRTNRHRNKSHKEALNAVVKRVVEELGIEPQEKNKIKFLRTLIRDYIVLTR